MKKIITLIFLSVFYSISANASGNNFQCVLADTNLDIPIPYNTTLSMHIDTDQDEASYIRVWIPTQTKFDNISYAMKHDITESNQTISWNDIRNHKLLRSWVFNKYDYSLSLKENSKPEQIYNCFMEE